MKQSKRGSRVDIVLRHGFEEESRRQNKWRVFKYTHILNIPLSPKYLKIYNRFGFEFWVKIHSFVSLVSFTHQWLYYRNLALIKKEACGEYLAHKTINEPLYLFNVNTHNESSCFFPLKSTRQWGNCPSEVPVLDVALSFDRWKLSSSHAEHVPNRTLICRRRQLQSSSLQDPSPAAICQGLRKLSGDFVSTKIPPDIKQLLLKILKIEKLTFSLSFLLLPFLPPHSVTNERKYIE